MSSVLHKKKARILLDYCIDDLGINKLAQKTKELIDGITALGIEVESTNSNKISKATSKGSKELITERDIERFKSEGSKTIYCDKNCLITPLALDRAKEIGILVIFKD